MSRPISFFSDYSSGENRVTNYCGLMLKMLYQERPEYFETVIANLVSDEGQIQIGPTFEQQTRSKKSVPDLAINQQGFAIYFETKLTDWFYGDQIERHLRGIAESKAESKIIFLLGNIEIDQLENRLKPTLEFGKSLYQSANLMSQ